MNNNNGTWNENRQIAQVKEKGGRRGTRNKSEQEQVEGGKTSLQTSQIRATSPSS